MGEDVVDGGDESPDGGHEAVPGVGDLVVLVAGEGGGRGAGDGGQHRGLAGGGRPPPLPLHRLHLHLRGLGVRHGGVEADGLHAADQGLHQGVGVHLGGGELLDPGRGLDGGGVPLPPGPPEHLLLLSPGVGDVGCQGAAQHHVGQGQLLAGLHGGLLAGLAAQARLEGEGGGGLPAGQLAVAGEGGHVAGDARDGVYTRLAAELLTVPQCPGRGGAANVTTCGRR